MNVICLKASSKLVKGGVYKLVYFNNDNSKKNPYFRPILRIYLNEFSIQSFPLENFKLEDGSKFTETIWTCPDYQLKLNEREQTKIDKNIKVGDYVIPLYDSLKTLIRGRTYKVSEVKFHDHKNNLGQITWTDIKIKLEGSQRWYVAWNFRKCSNQESRDINLKQLFDEKTNTETVNRHKRKFDFFDESDKKKLLIQFIIASASDRFRNQMDIIDWAITKSAKNYKLTRSDFEPIMLMSVSEIIKHF